ncbi:hypothetical protein SAMN06265171_10876 [Chryseobacterium rhizoplanae]|uniref:Uncharacterized protein n=1 Tax=Chryseobacterium rhizoplanae TaxID=1609531 RepID=A0A521EHW9_9FLAO|nr:hypothetical protein [Chryseobacterium rhizoplanae]SMO83442.1 hypothetical protein SAMN06265171_10876 [Chryseobacterium rhizoplanae]
MKKQFQNWTLFFVVGILAIIVALIASVILMAGVSANDGLFGIYILCSLIPIVLVMIIDRILVWKFGNKNVNKVQFSILLLIVLLWMVRFVVNLVI